jgi:HK97 family phage portal protein
MFEKMKSWFQKESRTGATIYTGTREAQWSKREYAAFADEGYRKNVIAYQAINKTAMAVATIPWVVRRPNGDELTEHPLLSLIENPNPMQSRYEFLQALVGFYRISGNGYMERVMVRSQPRELYALRSDRMTVKPSITGFPAGYQYRVGQEKIDWDADPRTGLSDIRHLKTFHPLDDWYGLSPIEAGAYGIDQHNETMKSIQATLQNGMTPSGALESQDELSDEQFNRMKAEIDEKYSGSANAGRPLLLEGGLKWTQMGLTPQSMAIIETKYSAARDISLALGVPPLLLNIPGDSTYSNYKEARLAFYEETVIPLVHYIRDELNAWLSDSFGGAMLDVDLDQVPAIADKRRELWTMADQATDLTINERREIKGYEEVEGGDTVYIPSNLIPLNFDMPQDDNRDPAEAGEEAFGNGDTDGE